MHGGFVRHERNVSRMLAWQDECQMSIRKLQESPGCILIRNFTLEFRLIPVDRLCDIINNDCSSSFNDAGKLHASSCNRSVANYRPLGRCGGSNSATSNQIPGEGAVNTLLTRCFLKSSGDRHWR